MPKKKIVKKKKKMVKKKKVARKSKPSVPELRLEIEYVSPDSVELWDDNPRKNDRAAKKIAKLISVHGFGIPVTVREEDGIVYKGNTRVKAAKILGMNEIPVMRRSYPDVETAKRDAIADNRAQEMAQWDEDALADMFQEREEVDLERLAAETGFEEVEIKGLRTGWAISEDSEDAKPSKGAARGNFATKCPHCGHEGPVKCGGCSKEFEL